MKKKNTTGKTATKPKKVAKKEKALKPKKSNVKFISFEVGATIPTMMYGNIVPSIKVEAPTVEEAFAFAFPLIEGLYAQYAVAQDGRLPNFINKAEVTVTEKKVEVPPVVKKAPVIEKEEKKGVLAEAAKETPAVATPSTKAETAEELADDLNDRSPAFKKARTAINSATSSPALEKIEEQIKVSIKISEDEKPVLLTDVLKKRKTFA